MIIIQKGTVAHCLSVQKKYLVNAHIINVPDVKAYANLLHTIFNDRHLLITADILLWLSELLHLL